MSSSCPNSAERTSSFFSLRHEPECAVDYLAFVKKTSVWTSSSLQISAGKFKPSGPLNVSAFLILEQGRLTHNSDIHYIKTSLSLLVFYINFLTVLFCLFFINLAYTIGFTEKCQHFAFPLQTEKDLRHIYLCMSICHAYTST